MAKAIILVLDSFGVGYADDAKSFGDVNANTFINIAKAYFQEKNKVIHLIGRTDIGTTYEIILCPDLLHNWIMWRDMNNHLPRSKLISTLKNVINTQNIIDKSFVLR